MSEKELIAWARDFAGPGSAGVNELADALKSAKADAWDEGEEAGIANQLSWDGWRYSTRNPRIDNPYRTAAQGKGAK